MSTRRTSKALPTHRLIQTGIAVGLAALLAACTENTNLGSPPSPATASAPSGVQAALLQQVKRDLRGSRFSLAKGELCDKLVDEQLEPTFGEMTVRIEGTKTERKLPAVMARHRFLCQNNYRATKEPTEQWVILGLDSEFDMVRCVRTGPPHYIVKLFQECNFRPNDQGFTFPPPEQVHRLWQADYAAALAKISPPAPNPAAADPWDTYKPLFIAPTCYQNDEGMLAAPWGNQRQPTQERRAPAPDGKSMTLSATFADGSQDSMTYFRAEADCKAAARTSGAPGATAAGASSTPPQPEAKPEVITVKGVLQPPAEAGEQYVLKLDARLQLEGDETCGKKAVQELRIWESAAKMQKHSGKPVVVTGTVDCPRGAYVLRDVQLR